MDKIREVLAFDALSDEWCSEQLADDFCNSSWPESWEYDKSLLGLENPLECLIKFVKTKENRFWDNVIISDVIRLQCITNIVLESCIQNEGSQLTGIYCGSAYIRICALEGASARNMFHPLLFGKVMELLKVVDDSECLSGILDMYNSLKILLQSDFVLPDHSYWSFTKSVLASINSNCTNKNVKKHTFHEIFSTIVPKRTLFKFFIKEASPYILSGNCYVADQTTKAIISIVSDNENSDNIMNQYINLIQHICSQISDRTELRKQTEVYILKLLFALPKDYLICVLEWVISTYSFSVKVVHRIFANELCFQLLFNENISKDEELCKNLLQTIVNNLHDKAPTVRAKSLMILSEILKHFSDSKASLLDPLFNTNSEQNILKVIEMLSLDEKSSVRKSVCHLLTMMLLNIKIRTSWLTTLYHLCLDTAVSVRKQGFHSVSKLLEDHWESPTIQRLWLETILPSINDNENAIKDYGISQLSILIDNLGNENSWIILKLIANPKSTDLQVYFDFGMRTMLINGYKISSSCKEAVAEKLENRVYRSTALLIVSKLANQFNNISLSQYIDIFENSLACKSDDNYQQIIMVLDCFKQKKVSHSDYDNVYTLLKNQLLLYNHPFAVVKELGTTLARLAFKYNKGQFLTDCQDMISTILGILQSICLKEAFEEMTYTSKKLSCYLFTMGEMIQFLNQSIDMNIVVSLKELIINNETLAFPTSVRAQAIVTLGKICLVHENIAKDSVTLLSRVLEIDESSEIRNNILVVLSDMIVRYPTLVQENLYCVTDCLHDTSTVVRRQAIILLTKLLQEDYLKWRSGVVMKFLSNLVDDNIEIRKLCELCLTNVLLVRHPKTYFDYFIEVVFFANALFSLTTSSEPNREQFSFPGPKNEQKRKIIYSKMLQNLNDQQKLEVTARICKEILSMFINESTDDIEEKMKPLLKDALWILCCPSLKLSSLKVRSNNDCDEDDAIVGVLNAQKKVVTNIVKRNFVENCAPIIIALRQKLRQLKSPMQQDLTRFTVSFINDYKDEIEVMAGADSQFVAEIQYDVQEQDKEVPISYETLTLNKTINHLLVTPGFLKMLKTPQSNRTLNITLANGPENLFRSPFFAVPSPKSATVKKAMRRMPVTSKLAVNDLRINLMDVVNSSNFAKSTEVSKQSNQTSMNGHGPEHHENAEIQTTEKAITNKVIKIQNSPKPESSKQILQTDEPDAEISYSSPVDLQESQTAVGNETSIKITNSPIPTATNADNLLVNNECIKQELLSPHQPASKVVKGPKTLYNPETAIDLSNVSNMSADKSLAWSTPSARLLLSNKNDKGVVKISRLGKSKRALQYNERKMETVVEDHVPGESKIQKNVMKCVTEKTKEPVEKKPFSLGELIKKKLKNQRQRKAEQSVDQDEHQLPPKTRSKGNTSTQQLINHDESNISNKLQDHGQQSKPSQSLLPKSGMNNDDEEDPEISITLNRDENKCDQNVLPESKHCESSSCPKDQEEMQNIHTEESHGDQECQNVLPEESQAKDINQEQNSEQIQSTLTDDNKAEIMSSTPEDQEKQTQVQEGTGSKTPSEIITQLPVSDNKDQQLYSGNKDSNQESDPNISGKAKSSIPFTRMLRKKKKQKLRRDTIAFKPEHSKSMKDQTVSGDKACTNAIVMSAKAIEVDEKTVETDQLAEIQTSENLKAASAEAETFNPSMSKPVNVTKMLRSGKERSQKAAYKTKSAATVSNKISEMESVSEEETLTADTRKKENTSPNPDPEKRKKRNVKRLIRQFQPISTQPRGDVIEKANDILLTNQVLRKRKVGSEYVVFNESDMEPPTKRRSIDDAIKMVDVTFDDNDPNFISSTPAPTVNKNKSRIPKFGTDLVTSTPIVPQKKSRESAGFSASTPAVGAIPVIQELDCDVSPIQDSDTK